MSDHRMHEISDEAIEAAWTQWWYEAWPHGTEPKAEKAFKAGAKWAAALPHMGDGRGEASDAESYGAEVDILKRANERLQRQLADANVKLDRLAALSEWQLTKPSTVLKSEIRDVLFGDRLSPTGDDTP